MATSTIKQQLTSIPVSISEGGTGASTKANAQTNLGIHEKIYDNSSLYNQTYTSSEVSYTATADGFMFALQSSEYASDNTAYVKVNNVDIAISDSSGSGAANCRCSLAAGMIKKGDTIKFRKCALRIVSLKA